jgi:hypothetical protein
LRTQKEGRHSSIPSYLVASLGTCEIIAVTIGRGQYLQRSWTYHKHSFPFELHPPPRGEQLDAREIRSEFVLNGHGRTWIRQKASQTWNDLDRPWHGSERH